MGGRGWTGEMTGARRRRHAAAQATAGTHSCPVAPNGRAGPSAGLRPETRCIHPSDLFGRFLARLCDCGDRAAVALRDELAEPGVAVTPATGAQGHRRDRNEGTAARR